MGGEGTTSGDVDLSSKSSDNSTGGVGGQLFDAGDPITELWDHYRQHVPEGQKQLTAERKRELKSALKARSLEDCKLAVVGLSRSPWHNGQNDTGAKYLELRYAIGKVKQAEAIGDRIDTMAKKAGTQSSDGTVPVRELLQTVPSGGADIVLLRMDRVRAMIEHPDDQAKHVAGVEAKRQLREAPPRCEPVVDHDKLLGWRRTA